MKIRDIYKKYDIIDNLAEHMLRTAGVGYFVASNWKEKGVDVNLTTAACLLHDVGNLVKFDLDNPIVEIDDPEKWRRIQKKYWDKYGKNTHDVTIQIIEELGREDVVGVIEEEGEVYGKSVEVIKGASLPTQFLLYSDVRVMPHGVTGMQDRIDDLQARYGNPKYDLSYLFPLEDYLQKMTTIDITAIDEEMVRPLFPQFLSATI